MTGADLFRTLENDARELRGIAEHYSKDSPQYGAIRHAALALLYVTMNQREEFASFLVDIFKELSPEEREQLRAYGLQD